VLLPAPLGPSNPNMPFEISRFTSVRAFTPLGYVLERLVILSIMKRLIPMNRKRRNIVTKVEKIILKTAYLKKIP
jgi:hypothetical protein